MDHLLSIAAGVSPGVAAPDFVAAAADAGWPACGIWFDAESWTADTAREVRRRLDDTGVIALDIEPVFVLPAGSGVSATTDHGEQVVEAAAAVGARNVLVVARGVESGPFTQRFGELCDLAAPAGITCVVEFMAFMSTRTLGDALAVVEVADRPNAGVLVDNLHLARTGSSPDELRTIDPSLLPYAQLCDAPAPAPDDLVAEALDGRLPIGEGGLPVDAVIDALPARSPLSMEVRSKALRDEFTDPTERARSLLRRTLHHFDPREQ